MSHNYQREYRIWERGNLSDAQLKYLIKELIKFSAKG